MSQLFASGGRSIGASASVLPVSIQGWFPLGWTGLKCSVLPHITAEPRVPPYLPPHPVFLAPSPFFLYPSNGSAPCCPTPLPTLMPLLPKSHPSGWSSACIPLLQACCPQVSFSISSSPFPSHHPPGSFSSSVKVKSESEVAQPCPTLSDPMDCSPPGSSVHGIFQATVLEWAAIAFSEP